MYLCMCWSFTSMNIEVKLKEAETNNKWLGTDKTTTYSPYNQICSSCTNKGMKIFVKRNITGFVNLNLVNIEVAVETKVVLTAIKEKKRCNLLPSRVKPMLVYENGVKGFAIHTHISAYTQKEDIFDLIHNTRFHKLFFAINIIIHTFIFYVFWMAWWYINIGVNIRQTICCCSAYYQCVCQIHLVVDFISVLYFSSRYAFSSSSSRLTFICFLLQQVS